MLLTVITIALISSAWLCYEMYRAPLIKKEEEDIDDPTTTFWHDDNEHHPDTNI